MNYHRILPTILQFCLFPFSTSIFKLFLSLKAYGKENVFSLDSNTQTAQKGVIFAVNHSSNLDVIIVRTVLPQYWERSPMYYVALARKYYDNIPLYVRIFYGGLLFRIWGAYPIYKGMKNYELSLQHFIKLLDQKASLTIFPEGKMTRDGNLAEGHGGVAYLSWKTGCPVIPVAIKGAYKIGLLNFLTARRKVSITFGQPFFPFGAPANAPGGAQNTEKPQEPSVDECKAKAADIMQKISLLLDTTPTR